jgi:Putative adhesin
MTPRLARRAGALTLIAATTVALAGCGGVGARLTFNDTEKKITEVDLAGHSGDVMVKTTAGLAETRITRIIRKNADPDQSYRLDGSVLHLNTDCGMNCSVSYQIEAPPGVTVTGTLSSGDVGLTDVAAADVTVTSGDVNVHRATGPVKIKATSGDIDVIGAAGPVSLQATSGNLRAVDIAGGPVSARATSGDVQLKIDKATSVTAEATSGDVQLLVPGGAYQVHARAGSGDTNVGGGIVTDPASKNVLDLTAGSGDVTVAAAA